MDYIARQAPLSMGFSRQEYWSGWPCPSPGDLLDPGIEPRSPALQAILYYLSHQGSPMSHNLNIWKSCPWLKTESLNLRIKQRNITYSKLKDKQKGSHSFSRYYNRMPSSCQALCAEARIVNRHNEIPCSSGTYIPVEGSVSSVSSVAQSCPTLCDPMNCSMPGLPVHHQLPEFTQTHVLRVGDPIQPSHSL